MIKGFKIANKNMPHKRFKISNKNMHHKRFKIYKQKYTLRKI